MKKGMRSKHAKGALTFHKGQLSQWAFAIELYNSKKGMMS